MSLPLLQTPVLLAAALVFAGLCLYLMLPRSSGRTKKLGGLAGLLGFALMIAGLPMSGPVIERIIFWSLAALALFSAVLAISVRSAVYTAIWFAISLIGVAGLFLYQGAQFLGVVTVVVYAGAIVVMFLFVIMLAQPEGHSVYDRIAWGTLPKFLAVATATLSVGVLGYLITRDQLPSTRPPAVPQVETQTAGAVDNPVLSRAHTASLGRELFSRHLISVELAGTLLLAALVGAVAIAMHGNLQRPRAGEVAQ